MTSQVAKVCLLFIPTVGLSRKRGLDSLETSHSIFSQHGGPRLPSTRREGKTGDLQSGSLVLLVSVLYSTDHSSLSRIVKAAVILLNVLNVNVKKTLLDIQYSKVDDRRCQTNWLLYFCWKERLFRRNERVTCSLTCEWTCSGR